MNRVTLIGNLGGNPEVKYTGTGTAVCNFTMATTEKYKGEEHTEWHRIVAWAKPAEIIGEYMAKGSKIMVSGKLQTREWEDRDGNKRYTTEVVVRDFEFLGGGKEDGRARKEGPAGQSDVNSIVKDTNREPPVTVPNDDIPF